MEAPPDARREARRTRARRLGIALVALGVILVLWGVFHVLEEANGPGTGPKTFAERRSYDQVKVAVHASLPGGVLRALAGAAVWWLGVRCLRKGTGGEPADA